MYYCGGPIHQGCIIATIQVFIHDITNDIESCLCSICVAPKLSIHSKTDIEYSIDEVDTRI